VINNRYMRALALLATLVVPSQTLQSQGASTTKALGTEQWRADLKYMMSEMEKRHANLYHATPRTVFDSAAKDLEARIPSLARHEIIAEMMKIVALTGDGHSNIYPTRDKAIDFHAFPIALYLFKDGWFIRAADSAHGDLVGAKVLRIGNVSIDSAFERIKPYIGRDNEMGAKFWAAYLLTMPEMLHASRISPALDSAQLQVEVNGKRRTVWLSHASEIPLTPADTDVSWLHRTGWVDAREKSGAPTPLWLTHRPDSTLWWFETIPNTRVGYAQINQVRNGDTEPLESFTDRLLQFTDTARIDRLIIDLRLNRGGNGNLIKQLERGLLRRPKVNSRGTLYILMGRSTWSASQFFLNDMAEFSEATFVGEPSGSRGNAYGDSRQIKLPNSGITARVSIYYWQDWNPTDTRPWIAPDIAAEMTFADYTGNRDPALAAAIADNSDVTIGNTLRALVESGDTVSARERFIRFRRDPVHVYVDGHVALDQVAVHFLDKKDLPRATWAFALAADQYPESARAYMNLAAVYSQAGEKEREGAALNRVLELEPDNSTAREILKSLGKK
jgi:hypothetical protein